MPPANESALNPELPQFKSQPWQLFDTVVSADWEPGDGTAIGAATPAISSQGEIVFFQSSGRTRATMPWYCNQDQQGTLSYGLEVWQMFVEFLVPPMPPFQAANVPPTGGVFGPTPYEQFVAILLQCSELELMLGQEPQCAWHLSRFGAGGGIWANVSNGAISVNSSVPTERNVLKLPEPIEMPRTQNLWAKIRCAPEVLPQLEAYGGLIAEQTTQTLARGVETTLTFPRALFGVRFGLVGRRIKNTQYGQIG